MGHGSRGKRSTAFGSLIKLINQKVGRDDAWTTIRLWHKRYGGLSLIVSGSHNHLLQSDDRSKVIVVSSLLEQALEGALATHFVTNEAESSSFFSDRDDGGATNFAMKIRLAYHLGVVEEKIKSELTLIKSIRNVFAHTRSHVSFDTPEIIDACNLLSIPDNILWDGVVGPKPETSRERFGESCALIYLYLSNKDQKPITFDKSEWYSLVLLPPQSLSKEQSAELAKALKAEPGTSEEK